VNTTYTTTTNPAQPAEPADMHAAAGDARNSGTTAGQRVYRLIWRIRRGRLVGGDLLASILIAAVAPVIQGNPVIMLCAATRE
jgi:hypothetical protein